MVFKKVLLLLLLPAVLIMGTTAICYANTPPPPAISIIVANAPKDLELSIGSKKALRRDKVFESYFIFNFGFTEASDTTLTVTRSSGTFEISLPPLQRFNNIFTLDLKSKRLIPGTSWLRPYEFALVTLSLTLMIEGLIFFLLGYKKRKSWIIFLVTNLITQGFLYTWLNGAFYPLVNSYFFPVLASLIFGEFLVFIIETIVYLATMKERRRLITASYAILANLASLFAGGYIINALI